MGLLGLGLAIALITVKVQSSKQHEQDAEQIDTYSNKVEKAKVDLTEQQQVAAMLEKDIEGQKKAYVELTNNYTKTSTELSQTAADLAKTQATLKEEVAKRDARIAELEEKNQALDKEAIDLSASITNLTLQIAETQHKLANSEGDKAFLEKELKRLMSEKAELERQFNDLTVLRAQVSRLKEELSIARRLEWIRQGVFARAEQKGAQQLMTGMTPATSPQAKATPKPGYDLNVEVNSDGSVKVIPPLTNAPAKSPR